MSSVYYALIILPLLFFFVLIFIFQSSLTQIHAQQYFINCPFPVENGVAVLGNPAFNGDILNYTIVNGNSSQSDRGSYFSCTDTNGLHGATILQKPYGATAFSVIPYGWYSWVGDTISVGAGKLQPWITLIYLYFNAPAVVTGIQWFSFIQLLLLGLVGLGVFMVVRGGA